MTLNTGSAPSAAPEAPTTSPVESPQAVPAPEAPQAEAAPKGDPDLSPRFAALARQEKRLLEERKAIAAQAKEIEEYRRWKSSAKEKPFEYLEAGGLSFDELVKQKLKEGKEPTVEDKLMTVEEKLKKLQEDRAREEDERKQANVSRAEAAFKDKIKSVVENDKAKYELIGAYDAHDEVFNVCKEYWEQNEHLPQEKRLLPVEKAAELVEAELEERMKKFQGVSKFKKLFTPAEAAAAKEEIASKAKDISEPEPTLTNKSAPAPSAEAKKPLLSREESIKQLAKQLEEKMRAAKKG
jgi:hypothetical protein